MINCSHISREERKFALAKIYNVFYAHFTFHCHMPDDEAEGQTLILIERMQTLFDSPTLFSAAIINATKEEMNLDDPHFPGKTFDKKKDQKRLMKTILVTFKFMSDEKWHSLPDIFIQTGLFPTTAYRNVARLSQIEYGNNIVERRRVKENGGTWEYKLTINRDSLTYREYQKRNFV